MRKIKLLIIIMAMLVIVAGCGRNTTDTNESEEKDLESTPVIEDSSDNMPIEDETELTTGEDKDSNEPVTGEVVQSVIKRGVQNDKFLKVLSMSEEDIRNILGEPDIEDWWSGPYIYYEDASQLIGDNHDGLSSGRRLMVWTNDDGDAVMIYLDSFLNIETGMSFAEAMEFLNADLEVYHDKEWGELGEYIMSYSIGDYWFDFYSYESIDGPIEGINAGSLSYWQRQ